MSDQPLQRVSEQPLQAPTPMELINRAVTAGAQVETMDKLLGLQERWEKNEARKAFDNSIAKAKPEIPVIRKGNLVDFASSRGRTSYRYEDLATIAQTVDPVLSKYGLSYRWRTNSDAKSVTVTCILSHSAGHSEENTLYAPHDLSGNKNPIQAVGSAVTYLQRYTLKAALGLAAAADDDARSASPPAPQRQESQAPLTTKSAESQQPMGEVTSTGKILMVTRKDSLPTAKNKWTAYFILWENENGQKSECATFSASLADEAGKHSDDGGLVRITTKPGNQPGRRELVRLAPDNPQPTGLNAPFIEPEEDDVPMEFDAKGQPEGNTP